MCGKNGASAATCGMSVPCQGGGERQSSGGRWRQHTGSPQWDDFLDDSGTGRRPSDSATMAAPLRRARRLPRPERRRPPRAGERRRSGFTGRGSGAEASTGAERRRTAQSCLGAETQGGGGICGWKGWRGQRLAATLYGNVAYLC